MSREAELCRLAPCRDGAKAAAHVALAVDMSGACTISATSAVADGAVARVSAPRCASVATRFQGVEEAVSTPRFVTDSSEKTCCLWRVTCLSAARALKKQRVPSFCCRCCSEAASPAFSANQLFNQPAHSPTCQLANQYAFGFYSRERVYR